MTEMDWAPGADGDTGIIEMDWAKVCGRRYRGNGDGRSDREYIFGRPRGR